MANVERIREELAYSLDCQRLGMKGLARAAFRRAKLLAESVPA